ncbi:hypothetical protein N9C91_02280 [Luminiphilus sp.]|nr:hypothetical protein [Luminiphilus sp.]
MTETSAQALQAEGYVLIKPDAMTAQTGLYSMVQIRGRGVSQVFV